MTATSGSTRLATVVRTTSGPVVGLVQHGIAAYKEIPYAAPPFGKRRSLAPQPHDAWTEPFQAFQFGATSPQREHAAPGGLPDVVEPVIPGQDILNLNVWTAGTDGSGPVLVWIHGGGFFAGCSANPEGFLELGDAPSNRGLLDCIAALEWVRDNVAVFGGDPDQVTVMGQSAGGIAVAMLLASTRAQGLFQQAIIASGITRFAAWSDEQARSMTDQFLDAVQAGRGKSVPVLAGTTKNEFAWRGFRDQPDSAEAKRRGQREFADDLFRRPTELFAERRVVSGSAPTYRYEFQWESTAAPYILAGHSLDIPFFFNNLSAPYVQDYTGPNPPQEIADFDHSALASFVSTGSPGWPPFSANSSVMIIDLEPHLAHRIEYGA